MRVAIIGTGYVGAVTGACLAEKGNEVICVDKDPEKVSLINDGRAPIVEPELNEIIHKAVQEEGTLRATTDLGKAVARAEVVLLSLPTPAKPDGSADTSYIFGVAKELAEYIQDGTLVATRSTVPIGTTRRVGMVIAEKTTVLFAAVSNPEFLAEGTAVDNTRHPDRVIIGADAADDAEPLKDLYLPFVQDDPGKIRIYDTVTAETVKMAANTLLAGHIAMVNVIAEICEKTGADYREVQEGVKLDHRVGRFLHPSPGFGGACFPKDVRSLTSLAAEYGVDASLFKNITESNEWQKRRWLEKITAYFEGDLRDKKIAVWGMSFKPNTDDVRESSALGLVAGLSDLGALISAYDPEAIDSFKKEFDRQYGARPNVMYARNKYDAIEGADALVILTEWGTFSSPDFDHMSEIMNTKVIFDARSIYPIRKMMRLPFRYESIGRPVIHGK